MFYVFKRKTTILCYETVDNLRFTFRRAVHHLRTTLARTHLFDRGTYDDSYYSIRRLKVAAHVV